MLRACKTQIFYFYATEGCESSGKVIGAMDRCQQDRLPLLETSEVLNASINLCGYASLLWLSESLYCMVIFCYVFQVSPPHEQAIDVGCGGGQSTEILAPFFKKVQGFDPCESQIAEATRKNKLNNISYR